ncbi:ATP-binding protein [Adhaeribacter radiodurans]|uniref:Oxygen sensor histidine kinase NreB n=1 Tax=Adhaeribacter radiodurans TaxID=2745197 RepID=A0A7L7L2X8_9BACT|nr:type IV pili methyl-accepting chemotaxis transducer N-terminal domain-containing protein [Adhaeribacter radiodurans]QMU27144.1 type IV pili methyl-accepting chemotaxis transducer N-terminal domain-containing protein [Adhaeribacter radiodurans]
MNSTIDANISNKITRLYLLALTVVAILLLVGQLLVQRSLRRQLTDSRIINIAGRQRMLSQKICKTVLLLYHQKDRTTTPIYITDLREALNLWEKSHTGLKNGYLAYLKIPVNNSAIIRNKFSQIDPLFQSLYNSAKAVGTYYQTNPTPNIPSPEILTRLNYLLKNERAYLQAMNQIVFQYDAEASERVNNSQRMENIVLFFTLGILLLEALFVFRPAVTQIKSTIHLLLEAKQQTQLANEELIRANKTLAETKEALLIATNQKYQQEINEQKLRSTYLLEGQEEERKRVAREIHDGLGQMLTALKYGLEKTSDAVPNTEITQQNLNELRQLVSQTITEARTISFNLMPAVLSDFGLASALKLLSNQVASGSSVNVSFNTNWNGKRLAKNVEIGLYRVSQEALHNAVKYAGANSITVDLQAKKKFIHLSISDNGHGFKLDTLTLPTGKTGLAQGISNMKERVFLLNGHIQINSKPGQGTQIHVKIPFLTTDHD